MFKLEIDTGNAAFDGGACREEVARILREAADQVETGVSNQSGIYDINGNRCGSFRLDHTQEL